MACYAAFGHGVHLPSTNLYLDRHGMHGTHADQRRVQRLIAVGLWDGNVVFEAAGHGLVDVVYHAQGAVAGVHSIHNDAERADFHDVPEGFALRLHTPVDGIEVLVMADHFGVDAVPAQGGFYGEPQFLHQCLAFGACLWAARRIRSERKG